MGIVASMCKYYPEYIAKVYMQKKSYLNHPVSVFKLRVFYYPKYIAKFYMQKKKKKKKKILILIAQFQF